MVPSVQEHPVAKGGCLPHWLPIMVAGGVNAHPGSGDGAGMYRSS